jgi:hypothetical protein
MYPDPAQKKKTTKKEFYKKVKTLQQEHCIVSDLMEPIV